MISVRSFKNYIIFLFSLDIKYDILNIFWFLFVKKDAAYNLQKTACWYLTASFCRRRVGPSAGMARARPQ